MQLLVSKLHLLQLDMSESIGGGQAEEDSSSAGDVECSNLGYHHAAATPTFAVTLPGNRASSDI